MEITNAFKESRIKEHISSLCFTNAGREYILRKLKTPTTNTYILKRRANNVIKLRKDLDGVKEILSELKEAEAILDSHIVSEASASADAQIQFTGEHTKYLNHIPFLLTGLCILKIYITPLLALTSPLIIFLMPYFIMGATMNIQIPWDTYVSLMKQMVLGIDGNQELGLKHVAQIFYFVFSIGQAIIQPFITAYHTIQVDRAFCKRGIAIQTLYRQGQRLRDQLISLGIHVPSFPKPPDDIRRTVVWYESTPLIKATYMEGIGAIDMYYSLALDNRWKPVEWSDTTEIIGLYDQSISAEKAVKNNISLGSHALLTGPNRGGKSSILRGVLQAVIYAQTLGLTLADSYCGRPFTWIHTHLQATDRPGLTSLFEQDVKEASDIIKKAKKTPGGLVLIDELFHSTNPPDAEISARHFLKQLWPLGLTSLISTHTFNIVKESPETIKKVCVFEKYKLQEGTCFKSSVNEILKEAGLMCG